jgi:hypothetical protein
MTSNELPIACSLTDPEFQQRRADLLKIFQGALLETKELDAVMPIAFLQAQTGSPNWLN